jgi:zeaxanthin glucosyltransferase
LPATVTATGVDALVLDPVLYYAELGAIQLGMPYINVSAALHLDYTGYTPLCLYGWPHQTTLQLWPGTERAWRSLLER